MPYLSGGSCKARAAHVGRCRMGRGAARRREMLLAAAPGAGDRGVVAGAAARHALPATDAHGTAPPSLPSLPAPSPQPPTLASSAPRYGADTLLHANITPFFFPFHSIF